MEGLAEGTTHGVIGGGHNAWSDWGRAQPME